VTKRLSAVTVPVAVTFVAVKVPATIADDEAYNQSFTQTGIVVVGVRAKVLKVACLFQFATSVL
jgi:hypothetical protein